VLLVARSRMEIKAFQAIVARYTTGNCRPGFGYQVCIPYFAGYP
jgi:hypothetical protein